MSIQKSLLCILTFYIISCSDDPLTTCSNESDIISEYTTPEGDQVQIFEDGNAYFVNDNCSFAGLIFEPDFFTKHYEETQDGVSIIVNASERYPVHRSFSIDFENVTDWRELLLTEDLERDRFFTNITLQSPSAPDVASYNALQRCLLTEECAFNDNRIDIVTDPQNSENQALRFFAVAPSADMVTSKSSIAGSTLFFQKGDDFWFQARYYIEQGRPLTIADFESEFFLGFMGPRLIFRGTEINVENKFGAKLSYGQLQNPGLSIPVGQWTTVKAHLQYDENDGLIRVWQDGQLVVESRGQNIPFANWIQNLLEVGISATQEDTALLIDDIQFSNKEI